jgi:hypothetical protein
VIRFAFAGRCSTEDLQDPEASRNWQLTRARALIEPAGAGSSPSTSTSTTAAPCPGNAAPAPTHSSKPSAIRDRVSYRCEYKEQEAALYPGLDHPRTINLREDIVCRALDAWITRAFDPDRLTATIIALGQAGIAASAAQTQTPEQAQARQAIKECERRLARYQPALDSGAGPAVVTQWINDAQRNREAAEEARRTAHRHPEERTTPRRRPDPGDY